MLTDSIYTINPKTDHNWTCLDIKMPFRDSNVGKPKLEFRDIYCFVMSDEVKCPSIVPIHELNGSGLTISRETCQPLNSTRWYATPNFTTVSVRLQFNDRIVCYTTDETKTEKGKCRNSDIEWYDFKTGMCGKTVINSSDLDILSITKLSPFYEGELLSITKLSPFYEGEFIDMPFFPNYVK